MSVQLNCKCFLSPEIIKSIDLSDHRTFDEAFDNIENFVESIYNEKRLHSKIGYLPPKEFEEALTLNSVAQLVVRWKGCTL